MIDSVRPPARRLAAALLAATTAVVLAPALAGSATAAPRAVAAPTATAPSPTLDSRGTDFWEAFPINYDGDGYVALFLSGPTTTGTVSVPGIGFSTSYSVTAGTVTEVDLPSGAQVQSAGTVTHLGIHITAGKAVSVYGLSNESYTTDAYVGLPTASLGTTYYSLGYEENIFPEELTLVGTQAGTTVTITPTGDTDSGHPAGTPYSVSLGAGDTYLETGNDISGSKITSNKPISVFGGNQCTDIPAGYQACDFVVEQMVPSADWGKDFIAPPLATRTGGDVFRFVADTDGTKVTVDGGAPITANAGQVTELTLASGRTAHTITSTQPIELAQYSQGSDVDGVPSDPMEMLIPPYEQYLTSYTVSTPDTGSSQTQETFPTNYLNLVVATSGVSAVRVDGTAVPSSSFTAVPGTSFSSAQVAVTPGSHTVSAANPIGVFVYGFADYNSYGYAGGEALGEVATVSSVTLSLTSGSYTVGQQGCVTATVTDQFAKPVAGVRVDFTVTGANTASGQAFTDSTGKAPFCYTGTHAGPDTVKGAVGTVSGTATVTWSAATTDTTPPVCQVTRHPGTTPASADAVVSDSGSGIASIVVTKVTNASYTVNGGPSRTTTSTTSFSPPTSSADVHTVRVNNAHSGVVNLRVTDAAGNTTTC